MNMKRPNKVIDSEYKEESRPHYLVEGVVHRYDPSEHEREERETCPPGPLCQRSYSSYRGSCQAKATGLWESVTSKLQNKEYDEATHAKQVIKQPQGDEAGDRKYFEKDIQSGIPTITQAEREVLEAEIKYEHKSENEDGVESGIESTYDSKCGVLVPKRRHVQLAMIASGVWHNFGVRVLWMWAYGKSPTKVQTPEKSLEGRTYLRNTPIYAKVIISSKE
ncbi:hypothetical protein EDB87DRAFT_1578802 [Lactarius vividus]|nr:hypothetical protein EDB87DRAFT_1578802 [Lactarius vividus]